MDHAASVWLPFFRDEVPFVLTAVRSPEGSRRACPIHGKFLEKSHRFFRPIQAYRACLPVLCDCPVHMRMLPKRLLWSCGVRKIWGPGPGPPGVPTHWPGTRTRPGHTMSWPGSPSRPRRIATRGGPQQSASELLARDCAACCSRVDLPRCANHSARGPEPGPQWAGGCC